MPGNDLEPSTASVFTADPARKPYARRSINAILGIFVAVFLVGAFVAWYFFAPDDVPENTDPSVVNEEQAVVPPQLPGNNYKRGTGRSSVYNFFYTMFGGIENGLDDNPHNLNNVENIDQFNLDNVDSNNDAIAAVMMVDNFVETQEARVEQVTSTNQEDGYRHSIFDVVNSDVWGRKGDKAGTVHDILVHKETGAARAIIMNDDDAQYERDLTAIRFNKVLKQQSDGDVMMTVMEEKIDDQPDFLYSSLDDTKYVSLRHLRDGQLIDFEGKVAGQIDAIIYENAEAQNIFFTLRPLLAQEGVIKFQLPFEDAQIVESPDGYDIQLSEEQTVALAEALFDNGTK